MTEAKKIVLLATGVMGWCAVIADRDEIYEFPLDAKYPCLVVGRNAEWTWLWRKRNQCVTNETWNPFASDSDAFMLVDAMCQKPCGDGDCFKFQMAGGATTWWAIFHHPYADGPGGLDFEEWFASDPSPNRRAAICGAALRWVEAQP